MNGGDGRPQTGDRGRLGRMGVHDGVHFRTRRQQCDVEPPFAGGDARPGRGHAFWVDTDDVMTAEPARSDA